MAAVLAVTERSLIAKFLQQDEEFLKSKAGTLADPLNRAANYTILIELAIDSGERELANNLYKRSITTGVWPKEMSLQYCVDKMNNHIANMNELYPSTPIAPVVLKARRVVIIDPKESKVDLKTNDTQNKNQDPEKKEAVQ